MSLVNQNHPTNDRVHELCNALRAYGVFDNDTDETPARRCNWLGSFFVVGFLEAFRTRNIRLMEAYLEQAKGVLFEMEFGVLRPQPEATGERRGR